MTSLVWFSVRNQTTIGRYDAKLLSREVGCTVIQYLLGRKITCKLYNFMHLHGCVYISHTEYNALSC